mmetsp:Transcript_8068/g.12658  ORF Transcript_8068/g.12658 Transcript_8068/m.12658 type:complete len:201 (+) Transcript_8068:1500-2102(+)
MLTIRVVRNSMRVKMSRLGPWHGQLNWQQEHPRGLRKRPRHAPPAKKNLERMVKMLQFKNSTVRKRLSILKILLPLGWKDLIQNNHLGEQIFGRVVLCCGGVPYMLVVLPRLLGLRIEKMNTVKLLTADMLELQTAQLRKTIGWILCWRKMDTCVRQCFVLELMRMVILWKVLVMPKNIRQRKCTIFRLCVCWHSSQYLS